MKGGSKEYWFVLTAENLSWYKDDEVSWCLDTKGLSVSSEWTGSTPSDVGHWTEVGCKCSESSSRPEGDGD